MSADGANLLLTEAGGLITGAAVTAGLAGLGWLWRAQHLGRAQSADQQVKLLQSLESRLATLDRQVTERDLRIDHLMAERQQHAEQLLRANLALADKATPPVSTLKALIDNDPGLMFAKRRIGPGQFVMVRVSPLYAELYLGGSPYDYDGKADSEIWPRAIAEHFAENDERIYRTQKGEFVREPANSPFTGVRGTFHGRKYPVQLHDREDYIIAVGEHLTPNDDQPELFSAAA